MSPSRSARASWSPASTSSCGGRAPALQADARRTPLAHGRLSLRSGDAACARFGERRLNLTAIEFAIVKSLLARPAHVLSRAQLIGASHAASIHVSQRTIDSHIRNIRAKLAEAGARMRSKPCMASASGSGVAAVSENAPGDKWRPRIGLVVLAILLTVMALPLVGLFFFRIYENQLVRQTEAELIGQGAAIAAIYAREVGAAGLPPDKLGAAVAAYRPQRQQRRR